MGINQKDIKLLWGRSGNRCAICRTELTQDKKAVSASFTLGEQAHIVGEKEDASRGKSPLDENQRNSYHNLILLCPTHHTEIDKNIDDWPVEKLHLTKSTHELWVSETLSETVDHFALANQLVITSIIDTAVEKCHLEKWGDWTSFVLSSTPSWPKELPDDIYKFRQKVISAVWPEGFDSFKKATVNFSIKLNLAAQKFIENCNQQNNFLTPDKFYKNDGHFNPDYEQDLERYNNWIRECYQAMIEATKAANLFADTVRKHINPSFFAEKGKFITMESECALFGYTTYLHEYSEEEKAVILTQ